MLLGHSVSPIFLSIRRNTIPHSTTVSVPLRLDSTSMALLTEQHASAISILRLSISRSNWSARALGFIAAACPLPVRDLPPPAPVPSPPAPDPPASTPSRPAPDPPPPSSSPPSSAPLPLVRLIHAAQTAIVHHRLLAHLLHFRRHTVLLADYHLPRWSIQALSLLHHVFHSAFLVLFFSSHIRDNRSEIDGLRPCVFPYSHCACPSTPS